MRKLVLAVVLGCQLGAAEVSAQYLALFFPHNDCDNVFGEAISTVEIAAVVADPGVTGVEFSIRLFPSGQGYYALATPNPAATVQGDPLNEGVRMTFPECRARYVTLYTVQVVRTPPGPPVRYDDIVFGPHSSPSNPNFQCPVFISCDSPVPAFHCTFGAAEHALDPPSSPFPAHQSTGVDPNGELRYFAAQSSSCILAAPSEVLDFGTNPDPPFRDYAYSGYRPGPMAPFTTYFWRIRMAGPIQYSESPVWSFTTGDLVGVEPQRWSAIKGLYR